MIALWGPPADAPIAAVRGALEAAGEEVLTLDPDAALDTAIELDIERGATGHLSIGDRTVDLGQLRGVYVRPPDPTAVPTVARAGAGSPAWRHAIALHEALRLYTALTDAHVVNRLGDMASNSSKPFQARLIADAGFAVPETLLTTDPDAARAFFQRHGDVVYKSVSGVRSIVGRLDADKRGRLGFVQNCPTQFQRYVPGVDHRVHVIGTALFVTRVVSDAVDYRYAGREGRKLEMSTARLPAAEATRCRALARTLGLAVAGIDLRLAPDGRWFCFEVNPSPAFTFYGVEDSGAAMAAAVANLLVGKTAARGTKPAGKTTAGKTTAGKATAGITTAGKTTASESAAPKRPKPHAATKTGRPT